MNDKITFSNSTPTLYLSASRSNSHLTPFSFVDGSSISPAGDYNGYALSFKNSQDTFFSGSLVKNKMIASKNTASSKLNKRVSDYSAFGINSDLSVDSKILSAKSQLNTVPSPVSKKPVFPDTANDTLLEVLKESSENNSIMMSALVSAFDESNKQSEARTKALTQQNSILLEQLSIQEKQFLHIKGFMISLNESVMSLAQSAGYIPTIVEAISISSDKSTEVSNIANSHAHQKNVNDSVHYNNEANDDNNAKRSLQAIASNVGGIVDNTASIATSTSSIKTFSQKTANETKKIADETKISSTAQTEIEKHQKIQAELATEHKLDIDDENSPVYQEFLNTMIEELGEFDIFSAVLNNRVGVLNGN